MKFWRSFEIRKDAVEPMEYLTVTIETLSPVVLTAMNNATVMTESRDFISGSVLRGVLASRYIRVNNLEKAHENEEFKKLFFGALRFVDAYPVTMGKRSFVVPLSLQKGKIAEKNDSDEEILLDVMQQSPKAGYKGMKGFAVAELNQIVPVSVRKQIKLHMSRASEAERLSGRSLEGSIYNYEAVEAGQVFQGIIIGEKDDLELLLKKVKKEKKAKKASDTIEETSSFDCRIGRSKFTEYGHCRLTVHNKLQEFVTVWVKSNIIYLRLETPWIPSLKATLFSQKETGETVTPKLTEIIPVTTVLNAFAKEVEAKLSFGKNIIMEGAIKKEGIIKVENIIAKSELISNFVGVWGMKRPEQQALMAGSIFSLSKNTEWNEEELQKLQELLCQGQGLRTEEGFGQLRIWTVENPVLKETKDNAPEKPLVFSEQAKNIAENILMRHILTSIRLLAASDVQQIKGNLADANHSFARLESLLGERKDLPKAKENFQNKLQKELREKSVLDKHLKNLRLRGTELKDFLCPEDKRTIAMPYATLKFEEDFPSELKELDKDIGFVHPGADNGALFYEYWLWFFRHGRKLAIQKRGDKE